MVTSDNIETIIYVNTRFLLNDKMKFFSNAVLALLSSNLYSQQTIKHKVVSGESVYSIAKKYQVTEKEIFSNNPKAKGVLALHTVLLIPNKNLKQIIATKKIKESKVVQNPISHQVLAKETLFGIAKKYQLTIYQLENLNPKLKEKGLQVGMILNLVELKNKNIPTEKTEISTETYTIQPKDTKYKIAKQFKLSIQELENLNPNLPKDFPIGYVLNLSQNKKSEILVAANKETANEKQKAETSVKPQIINDDSNAKANIAIAKASENLGVKYKTGGTDASGFDCSGLIVTVFESIDVKLPRTSAEQADFGETIEKENAQKGDLIFFKTNGSSVINHVGLITEVSAEDIKFIHASSSSGVIETLLSEEYYAKRFAKINRVLMQLN